MAIALISLPAAVKVFEEGELIGFGAFRNKSVFEDEGSTVSIRILCIKDTTTSYSHAVNAVLRKAYEYCAENALMQVALDVSTLNNKLCAYLFEEHGFRIEKTSLQLIMGDETFYSSLKGLLCFKTVT